jgi:hypothetical protein
MAHIIAGRFPTFERAEDVAQRLYSHQINTDDVSIFFVTPPGQHATYSIGGDSYADPAAEPSRKSTRWGVVAGALVGLIVGILVYMVVWSYWLVPIIGLLLGAYFGSLTGALGGMRGQPPAATEPRPLREAGVMLAAHVDEATAPVAVQVLQESGAEQIEQADGTWKNGQWEDFDPTMPPSSQKSSAAS